MNSEGYNTYLDRACSLADSGKKEMIRQEILRIFESNQVSLAEARGVFIDVLDYIERALPIKTKD